MARCSHPGIKGREDLAAGDTTIYRAVRPGRLDCALPGRSKMSRMLRHRGKSRCRRGSQGRRGAGAPRDPRLLLRAPPPPGEGHQRERQRAPARLLPEGQDLDGATDAEANAAHTMLNRRLRKRLGWKCPQGVFCSQALHLL